MVFECLLVNTIKYKNFEELYKYKGMEFKEHLELKNEVLPYDFRVTV